MLLLHFDKFKNFLNDVALTKLFSEITNIITYLLKEK